MKPHACQTSPEVTSRCLVLKIQDVTLTEAARVHIYTYTHASLQSVSCLMWRIKNIHSQLISATNMNVQIFNYILLHKRSYSGCSINMKQFLVENADVSTANSALH